MGENFFKGDHSVLKTDASKILRGVTTQAAAREAYTSGDTTVSGRRSMFIACASK